jgi:hypothetical protein
LAIERTGSVTTSVAVSGSDDDVKVAPADVGSVPLAVFHRIVASFVRDVPRTLAGTTATTAV